MTFEVEIVNGPNNFDLMLSLFTTPRKSVEFGVWCNERRTDILVIIDELTREDETGEKWHFRGFTTNFTDGGKKFGQVCGSFSIKLRKGWMEVENPHN